MLILSKNHNREKDTMEEIFTYSVYAFCDGLIVHEETVTNDYEDACTAFDDLVRLEREYRRDNISETTVHLSEPHSGILHAETTIV